MKSKKHYFSTLAFTVTLILGVIIGILGVRISAQEESGDFAATSLQASSLREREATRRSYSVKQRTTPRNIHRLDPLGTKAGFHESAPREPSFCIDNDGFDPFTKGFVRWKLKSMKQKKVFDDEIVGNGVMEYFCEGLSVRAIFVACEEGLDLENRACLYKPRSEQDS